jgi:hypothetical protein
MKRPIAGYEGLINELKDLKQDLFNKNEELMDMDDKDFFIEGYCEALRLVYKRLASYDIYISPLNHIRL